MCLITNLFVFRLEVFASESDYTVVKHLGSFSLSSVPWEYAATSYYTVNNNTSAPSSSPLSPNVFYTSDGVTFQYVSFKEVIILTLNKKIGVVLGDNELTDFVNEFYTDIQNAIDGSGHAAAALYTESGSFLGYAVNDISGCYYSANPVSSSPVNIPSEYVNNVYNCYNYFVSINSDESAYFVYHPVSSGTVTSNWGSSQSSLDRLQVLQSFLGSYSADDYIILTTKFFTDLNIYAVGDSYWKACSNEYIFVSYNTTMYDSFVSNFSEGFNDVDYNTLNGGSTDTGILIYAYDNGNVVSSLPGTSVSSFSVSNLSSQSSFVIQTAYSDYEVRQPISNVDFTVYRTYQDYEDININQSYNQGSFNTNSFNTFNPSSDNSFSATGQQVSQAVTTNGNIYSSMSNDFYNYVSNGNIDNSSIVTETTNIVNNYYGDNPDNPDNPDHPDNPDNPDTPLDWSDFIELLKHLLEAIGAIIVGIFEGLLSLITQVLEAIGSVVSNLDGFTDFLSALFGFLPSPVPEVIAAGFSLCILCAVIKFLRG